MAESHLSPQAYQRLQEELERRSTTGRKELSLAIEKAREYGDLRENSEYHAAKDEHGLNEARIRQLEQMLKNAVIIEGDVTATDVVEPGVVVEFTYEGDDEPTVCLVGSIEERNEKYSVLSTDSPLGQAMLGKSPGATVTYQGPKRELSVKLVAVRPLD